MGGKAFKGTMRMNNTQYQEAIQKARSILAEVSKDLYSFDGSVHEVAVHPDCSKIGIINAIPNSLPYKESHGDVDIVLGTFSEFENPEQYEQLKTILFSRLSMWLSNQDVECDDLYKLKSSTLYGKLLMPFGAVQVDFEWSDRPYDLAHYSSYGGLLSMLVNRSLKALNLSWSVANGLSYVQTKHQDESLNGYKVEIPLLSDYDDVLDFLDIPDELFSVMDVEYRYGGLRESAMSFLLMFGENRFITNHTWRLLGEDSAETLKPFVSKVSQLVAEPELMFDNPYNLDELKVKVLDELGIDIDAKYQEQVTKRLASLSARKETKAYLDSQNLLAEQQQQVMYCVRGNVVCEDSSLQEHIMNVAQIYEKHGL